MTLLAAWTDVVLLDPWMLALLLPAAGVLAVRVLRRRAALPAATLDGLDGLPRSLRSRLLWLLPALHGLAAAALVLALARPVTRDVLPIRELGVDIMMVLDVSSSMLSPDMDHARKTRIDAAKENAIAFAAARTTDRVGLITFARFPELRCPPTLDQDALAAFLRSVEPVVPRSAEDGTAIGAAVALAARTMEDSEAQRRVMVVLSDGEETVNELPPADAAKLAKDLDVRVHTIGIGQAAMGLLGPQEPTFAVLRGIAEHTGGRFFRARSEADLEQVYAAIDEMEKVELEDPRYRTTDLFLWPLCGGAALLALCFLLEATWLRGLP